jgi:hypothetical protein
VALEVLGDLGRLRVRVVSPNGVEDGHLIHHQLLGRAVEGVFSLHHETSLDAVFHIREFHSRVANGRTSMQLEDRRVLSHGVRDLDVFSA